MSFHWQIFTLNKSNFATDEGTTAHLLCVVGWGGGGEQTHGSRCKETEHQNLSISCTSIYFKALNNLVEIKPTFPLETPRPIAP